MKRMILIVAMVLPFVTVAEQRFENVPPELSPERVPRNLQNSIPMEKNVPDHSYSIPMEKNVPEPPYMDDTYHGKYPGNDCIRCHGDVGPMYNQ